MASPVLEVKNLSITLKQGKNSYTAVDHVSFALEKGKTLGIIGESGSGKSLTCMGVMGLLSKKQWDVQGEVYLNGELLDIKNRKKMERVRGNKIAMIMQNPMSAFNPVITIENHFFETINKEKDNHKSRQEVKNIAVALLTKMHIRDPEAVLKSYVFQLSGGMLQRIMIALALAVQPSVLVADEPTTALDMSVQHEIIKILLDVQKQYGMAILIISHDLGVIEHLSNEIAVMYAGDFIEKGTLEDVLAQPIHPYTKGLFSSRPAFSKNRLPMMDGQPPALSERAEGCRFYPRCKDRCEECMSYEIAPNSIKGGHEVYCLKYGKGR